MGTFQGRAVIVTGSSNGIGRATAQLFAREGAMVTICGRDKDTLEETKRLVLNENGNDEEKIVEIVGDVTDEELMRSIIDKTVQKFHRLDVLVNNAGGTSGSICVESELEEDLSVFDYVLNVNTRCVLRLCQLALPHLIKTKGGIVNVSSVAGLTNGAAMPFPCYSISKGAQDQLTRNLAIHYIKKGVRVNSVNPGIISTNLVHKQGFSDEIVQAGEAEMVADHSRVPCQRTGKPSDIAQAILFLADRERSGYILGHQLVVDGGSSLQMALLSDGFNIFSEIAARNDKKK